MHRVVIAVEVLGGEKVCVVRRYRRELDQRPRCSPT